MAIGIVGWMAGHRDEEIKKFAAKFAEFIQNIPEANRPAIRILAGGLSIPNIEGVQIPYHSQAEAKLCEFKKERRLSKSRTHGWLSGIEITFAKIEEEKGASDDDYVFVYPYDVLWESTKNNGVTDPQVYVEMIKAAANKPDLILGNYKTTDHTKEWAESQILGYLLGVFADHPFYDAFRENFDYSDGKKQSKSKGIGRIRTEFLGIKRVFFKTYFTDPASSKYSLISTFGFTEDDPTLQLVLSAIFHRRSIDVVDLGWYDTHSGSGNPMEQLKRVAPIIKFYRIRFQTWP